MAISNTGVSPEETSSRNTDRAFFHTPIGSIPSRSAHRISGRSGPRATRSGSTATITLGTTLIILATGFHASMKSGPGNRKNWGSCWGFS